MALTKRWRILASKIPMRTTMMMVMMTMMMMMTCMDVGRIGMTGNMYWSG